MESWLIVREVLIRGGRIMQEGVDDKRLSGADKLPVAVNSRCPIAGIDHRPSPRRLDRLMHCIQRERAAVSAAEAQVALLLSADRRPHRLHPPPD